MPSLHSHSNPNLLSSPSCQSSAKRRKPKPTESTTTTTSTNTTTTTSSSPDEPASPPISILSDQAQQLIISSDPEDLAESPVELHGFLYHTPASVKRSRTLPTHLAPSPPGVRLQHGSPLLSDMSDMVGTRQSPFFLSVQSLSQPRAHHLGHDLNTAVPSPPSSPAVQYQPLNSSHP